MIRIFKQATPESEGIPSASILRFFQALSGRDIPLHSFLLMRHDRVVCERYFSPYGPDTLHRMFSVTKSFVSLAVGLLCEEGKIALGDPVIRFFPEYAAGRETDALRALTIRDMLTMQTTHRMTSYKIAPCNDWVRGFFELEPDHRPGTGFLYDTSASHVLAALAEKCAGKPLLDYLRDKFLDALSFSPDAFCLKDAKGVSQGGSGLMATPYDLLRVMYVIEQGGRWRERQLLPREYLRQAVARQVDTWGKSFDFSQGYGYQIWRVSHGGFAFYGMGGQLCVCLPDKGLIFVTTADVQGVEGGEQLLLDAFWEIIERSLCDGPLPEEPALLEELGRAAASGTLVHVKGAAGSPLAKQIDGKVYRLDPNPMGFRDLSLRFGEDCGTLLYRTEKGACVLPFGIGRQELCTFPQTEYRCAVSGAWRDEHTFALNVQLIDTCVGSIRLRLGYRGDEVSLILHKYVENEFSEYEGVAGGVCQPDG